MKFAPALSAFAILATSSEAARISPKSLRALADTDGSMSLKLDAIKGEIHSPDGGPGGASYASGSGGSTKGEATAGSASKPSAKSKTTSMIYHYGKAAKGPPVRTSPPSTNRCAGTTEPVLKAVGLFPPTITCLEAKESSGTAAPKPQTGGDVTYGVCGELDVGDNIKPINVTLPETNLCAANVHWHLGAEHNSDGQYDEPITDADGNVNSDTGPAYPDGLPLPENFTGKRCHYYAEREENGLTDEDFKPYDFKHCVDVKVGETYEIHWPHSSLAACGEYNNQYQAPFTDGLLCNGPQEEDSLPIEFFPANLGVQAQIVTIVNNDDYYYPNLIGGMLVDAEAEIGVSVTAYTGSRTGGTFGDQPGEEDVCDNVSPVTWHVDRKCQLISASALDKLCYDIKTNPGMRQCGGSCDRMPESAKFVVTNEDDEQFEETCCFPDTQTGKSRGVNDPKLVANNQIDLSTGAPCTP